LGHNVGLRHCRDGRCVMYFSQGLADTDRKGPAPCRRCADRLRATARWNFPA
ncbi:MAG: pentalenene synthase, partial [Thermoplasmata archaeon]|nr:pentalenene synthase [Thermoplasmata archaeon]